jgi:hypothetical protein
VLTAISLSRASSWLEKTQRAPAGISSPCAGKADVVLQSGDDDRTSCVAMRASGAIVHESRAGRAARLFQSSFTATARALEEPTAGPLRR